MRFKLNLEKLDGLADYVIALIRDNYPSLDIPYHSRWRHIETGGVDRQTILKEDHPSQLELGRRRYDLIIVSILMDAGAGNQWSYSEKGRSYSRSEGLAVAGANMFAQGFFSHDKKMPLQTTNRALESIDLQAFAKGMQVSDSNPLIGLEGRCQLLVQLGAAIRAQPEVFGEEGRLGLLFDHISESAENKKIKASSILSKVLKVFGDIWPGREILDQKNLGDTWSYPGISGLSKTDQFVPFHKLSQWLSYSLFEPLEDMGIEITDLDEMTGLPEYRNGGLFIDGGVLTFKSEPASDAKYAAGDQTIVEWRALTVCLLDQIAALIRKKVPEAKDWPLAKILEGGTWAAGRKIAKSLRPDGNPPLNIISDGTVF